jgi:hypothetical protein
MGSCFRVDSSQCDSHFLQTTVKIKVAKHNAVLTNLTMLKQKPSIACEQASSFYSFRSSELSQPI